MSNPDLLLHLALDELHGDTLFDSATRRNGTAHDAKVVEDSDFGQCLELQGKSDSYVELPSLKDAVGASPALTVMCWFKLSLFDRNITLADLALSEGEKLQLSLIWNSDGKLLLSNYQRSSVGGSSMTYQLNGAHLQAISTKWVHLTFIRERPLSGGYFVNGRLVGPPDATATATAVPPMPSAPGAATPNPSYLGKSVAGNADVFKGRIAHFRIYKRVLTPEEINWEMEGDRPLQYRYRITHPLDFSLENRDADPTLFMDGHPDGQKMTLHADNVSSGILKFAPLPDQPPSETNCHFELAFRPGTLAPESLAKVTVSSADNCWKIASRQWKDPNDRDSLYLLCTRSEPFPEAGLTLQLDHLLPDSRYGTRTTLVDFRYSNLKSGANEPIKGSVQQNLDLVNHLGRRNIPLHVGFAGSNIVLNNSTQPARLRLRVTNILPHRDLLNDPNKAAGTGVLRFGEKSEFILTFDERQGTDWALNTPDKVGGIAVRYGKGQVTDNSPTAGRAEGSDNKPWQWKIPLKDFTLEPEEHLEIRLENVTASGAYGHSNLYLDYHNVPGYWDGRFTCVIDKAPLTYFNGKVGIGVAEPQAELEVRGTLKVDSLVTQPPIIHALNLKPGWGAGLGQTPKYFKDNQGIVHLTGECYFSFPIGWNGMQKTQWFASHSEVLDLPIDCVPALQPLMLKFPAHVQCQGVAQCWHQLFVHERSIEVAIEPGNLISEIDAVRVFLDGISYLAKS